MASSAAVFLTLAVIAVVVVSLPELGSGYRIWLNQSNRTSTSSPQTISGSKRFEGSSSYVRMQYHMGPVLSSGIRVYLIWYGGWKPAQKSAIRDFVRSVSAASAPLPSVSQWWKTVQLYTDQTGANVSKKLELAGEHHDRHYSHGKLLTRLSVQEVIKAALSKTLKPGSPGNLTAATLRGKLPADPGRGLYYVLTSDDVVMQDFCRAVCGFHYFTFPSIAGYTLPYAWVGNSGKQCPHLCAYPFAVPAYMTGVVALKPPNGDVGVDGMISVMAHELAEISSNPLINAWYAGDNPMAPTEIADLCEGIYGSGGGGSYMGQVQEDVVGASFNLHGVQGRRYMVQWIWNPNLGYCTGPNSLDG